MAEQTMLSQFIANSDVLDNQLIVGLSTSAKSFALSSAYQHKKQAVLYVAPTVLQATQVYQDLLALLPEEPIYVFPVEESIVAEFSTASLDLMAQRVEALRFLTTQNPGIVVTSLAGVRHILTSPNLFEEHCLQLSVGQELPLELFIKQLQVMGYDREKMVDAPGQFSVRGGIVDVFTLTQDEPIRIEFFDTQIDSIRYFDADTQKSLHTVEMIELLPAKDVLFDVSRIAPRASVMQEDVTKQIATVSQETVANQMSVFFNDLLSRLKNGELSHHPELYTALYYEGVVSIVDYLTSKGLIVLDDYTRLLELENQQQAEEGQWIIQKIQEAIVLPEQRLRLTFKDILKRITQRRMYFTTLQKGMGRMSFSQTYPMQCRTMPNFFGQMPLIKTEIERWLKQKMTIVVCVSDKQRAEKVSRIFSDFMIDNIQTTMNERIIQCVNIVPCALQHGFELPSEKLVVLTDRELFNKVAKTIAKRSSHLSNAEKLKSYSQLSVGDYVVHISHGIGRYIGMETLDVGGVKQDYMSIIYHDDAKLFIPVTQIHLIQKYVASDGREPKVNKLGGSEWAKTKKKVAKKIEDIADELIALYAQRESQVGYAFQKDTHDQIAFEEAFPYAETPDQLRSVIEIKKDMEKAKPMDRLLVGDVGYGKTEVAMRAIFKAVQEGKQVAFLVPTTILAQQHFMTLTQRFEDYPVVIELLSRFRTKAQQAETIEKLKKGQVDIVIGTHRLVSQDVSFSDLGLLVIDEEQRFGVKHKERLKQLKTQVDVLTLTATPIPRTLHMSLLGVRDLSVIETPPANRYPVQTYVMEQDYTVVKDAIERELGRDGQVFYLYNRVEDILNRADMLQQLVPQARIAVAHGQMSEVQLETVLMAFMNGEYDVLVTTTIVETGVDLPNVNTLFIEQADRFGLSQLYQLRGRVGRTNRIAYAYFMYQPDKALSETGEKRLEAIKEFTQLGAGFKIAMRDLSIRGAGNLLGQQQSGFIDSVGFDLYTEMLKDAVAFKQTGKIKQDKQVEIDLGITAYLPSVYIEDERQKIDLYKRIRTIQTVEDYHSIQDDLIDRFGDYPQEVADLVAIGLLKCLAEKQHVEKIKRTGDVVAVTYTSQKSAQLTAVMIFERLSQTKLKTQIKTEQQKTVVCFDVSRLEPYAWLDELHKYFTDKENSNA